MTDYTVKWRVQGATVWSDARTVTTGGTRRAVTRITGLANGTTYEVLVERSSDGATGRQLGPLAVQPSAAFEAVEGFTGSGASVADGSDSAQVGTLTIAGSSVPGVLVSVSSNNVLYDLTYVAGSTTFTLGGKTQANNNRYDYNNQSPGVATVQGSKSIFFPFPSPTPEWTAINIAFRPTTRTVTITPG